MTTATNIIQKNQHADDADGGVVCPVCRGPMEVMYTQNPKDHITRRRMCGRCHLRVTTSEKIVGGYTRQELEQAQAKWREWQKKHGREGEITPIQRKQLTLFKIEDY